MATSLEELKAFIEEVGWHCEEHDGKYLSMVFDTESYRNPDGEATVLLIADVMDEGAAWRVFAPKFYMFEDGPNPLAMLKACMSAGYLSKFVSYELDLTDGELRAAIEIPLQDSPLTASQVRRSINQVLWAVNYYHPMIAGARETGQVVPPNREALRLASLAKEISLLSPAALERVRAGLDKAIARAAAASSSEEAESL